MEKQTEVWLIESAPTQGGTFKPDRTFNYFLTEEWARRTCKEWNKIGIEAYRVAKFIRVKD